MPEVAIGRQPWSLYFSLPFSIRSVPGCDTGAWARKIYSLTQYIAVLTPCPSQRRNHPPAESFSSAVESPERSQQGQTLLTPWIPIERSLVNYAYAPKGAKTLTENHCCDGMHACNGAKVLLTKHHCTFRPIFLSQISFSPASGFTVFIWDPWSSPDSHSLKFSGPPKISLCVRKSPANFMKPIALAMYIGACQLIKRSQLSAEPSLKPKIHFQRTFISHACSDWCHDPA